MTAPTDERRPDGDDMLAAALTEVPQWAVDLTGTVPKVPARLTGRTLLAVALLAVTGGGAAGHVVVADLLTATPAVQADAAQQVVDDLTSRRTQLVAADAYAADVEQRLADVEALVTGQWPTSATLTDIVVAAGDDITITQVQVTTTDQLWAAPDVDPLPVAGQVTVAGVAPDGTDLSTFTDALSDLAALDHARVAALSVTDDITTFEVTATLRPAVYGWADGPPPALLAAIDAGTVGSLDDVEVLESTTFSDVEVPDVGPGIPDAAAVDAALQQAAEAATEAATAASDDDGEDR